MENREDNHVKEEGQIGVIQSTTNAEAEKIHQNLKEEALSIPAFRVNEASPVTLWFLTPTLTTVRDIFWVFNTQRGIICWWKSRKLVWYVNSPFLKVILIESCGDNFLHSWSVIFQPQLQFLLPFWAIIWHFFLFIKNQNTYLFHDKMKQHILMLKN